MLSGQSLEHMLFDSKITYETYSKMSIEEKINASINWIKENGIVFEKIYNSIEPSSKSKIIASIEKCSEILNNK